jgi:hypothetical protein
MSKRLMMEKCKISNNERVELILSKQNHNFLVNFTNYMKQSLFSHLSFLHFVTKETNDISSQAHKVLFNLPFVSGFGSNGIKSFNNYLYM